MSDDDHKTTIRKVFANLSGSRQALEKWVKGFSGHISGESKCNADILRST